MVTYFVCIILQSEGNDTLGLQQCENEDSARRASMREGERHEEHAESVMREEEHDFAM
ncbi:hypothetical protein TSUD_374100 [Trifolium subterraneum]|uniref:Uncharacterized protein n=1 Tax=Trifolium subterraneum TaxID=3900 RepID=A0A2Z6NYJ8_TRISU|nr:hypothetical protein TSUD_374100 [Trifolium subterraneum]